MKKKNPHTGSSFDDFLKVSGMLESVEARALKRALAMRVQNLMTKQKLTKSQRAPRLVTIRAAVIRNPKQSSGRPSTGTAIADKHRARLNTATGAPRSALFAKGMKLIYGTP